MFVTLRVSHSTVPTSMEMTAPSVSSAGTLATEKLVALAIVEPASVVAVDIPAAPGTPCEPGGPPEMTEFGMYGISRRYCS
jgi:hypothetical protein